MSYIECVGLSYVGLGIGIVLGAAIQGAGASKQVLLLDAASCSAFSCRQA